MKKRLDRIQWELLAKEAGYSLPEMARLSQVSTRQLQRHFRRHFNCQARVWVSKLRIREACELLPRAGSVKEVAMALGFKQASHFCRHFKKFHGCKPGELLGTEPAWVPAEHSNSSPQTSLPPADNGSVSAAIDGNLSALMKKN
jgi:AraC-like DNA-binding protein